jgi:hypothetical protein
MNTIDAKLKCHVLTLEYSPVTRLGRLYMDAGHCCDMTACIRLFSEIDPRVRVIHTISGAEHDTMYVFKNGEWHAVP